MAAPKGRLVTPTGFRADGSIHALELDDNDLLKVALVAATATVMISANAPSLLKPVPKSIIFQNLNLPAGNSTQYGLTVPANTYYRFSGVRIVYTGTVAGVVLLPVIYNGLTDLLLDRITPIVSGNVYGHSLNVLLSPGWKVGVQIVGATLNDDFYEYVFIEQVY